MNDKISVLAVEPMKAPYIKEIEPGLESCRKRSADLYRLYIRMRIWSLLFAMKREK